MLLETSTCKRLGLKEHWKGSSFLTVSQCCFSTVSTYHLKASQVLPIVTILWFREHLLKQMVYHCIHIGQVWEWGRTTWVGLIEPCSTTNWLCDLGQILALCISIKRRGWTKWSLNSIKFWESQFSSVTQSCPILCNSMNRSTPGLPVHHQLPEFTQTHVHRVGDAIQLSHPLSSPSPAPNPSQDQGLFQWVNSTHEVAKVLEFQLQHDLFNI